MRSVSEKIDERILRLLGLEDVFDLDYDTYLTLLKEAIVTGSKKLPQEELALLANERKRVRGKKGRFKPKKDKITADKVATTKFLKPAKKKLALAPSTTSSEEGAGGFVGIKKTLDSILSTLGSKFKFDQKQVDQDRKEKETEKRGKREASLEGFKKGVAGIVATTKKLLDPFQAIIDRIFKFIFFTLLGRAFTKFMEWMSDKGNQEKFNSFIEFLTDHWPALAGLYVLFGTSFGKLVRGLLKGATRMIVALAMNIPKIFAFIRKNKKLAFLALAAAPLVSREIGNLFTDKETPESGLIPTKNPELDQAKQSADQAANTKIPTLNFGGMVPSFKMGGVNAFTGMDFSGGVPITGAGQDDTLIAAKTGEAILTEKDQVDLGQRYVDRNTGQPLNVPQYLAGRKPGSVNLGNLRFPGFGGGFFNGGMISKFNNGGIVGGVMNFFNRPRGLSTRGAQAGFTGMSKTGFESIMSGAGFKNPNKPSLVGKGSRPVLGHGAYSAPTTAGASRYVKPGGGIVKTIVPGGARGINFIEPQSVVSPSTFDKGKVLTDKLLSGKYSNSPLANRLRSQLTSGVAQRTGMGLGRLLSRGAGLMNAPVIGDMLFPQGTSVYDQLTGPNAYYNAPGYKGPKPMQRMGGGLIKENTGMNVKGATADRQHILAQPGEYVLPVDTVNRLGVSLIDTLVAMTDSNSNAYLKKGTINRPQITPYNSFGSGGGMMTLPPITQSAGGSKVRSAGLGGGSEVPEFSAIAPGNERAINASIYGLVG
jgi:hypothetical protein